MLISKKRGLLVALVVAWVAVIVIVCLTPDANAPPITNPFRLCIVCGHERAAAGMVMNAVLYVPLGILLELATGSVLGAFLGGVALSGIVEATQLMIPGRFSTLEDLLMNSLGALFGAVFAVRAGVWLFPKPRASRWIAISFAVVSVAIILGAAGLLESSVPSGRLYSQWTPSLPGLERYRGRVMSATLDEIPIPNGLLGPTQEWRARLLLTGALDVRFEIGPRPSRLAPVLRLVARTSDSSEPEDRWEEILLVAVDREDLVVRTRYRADDWRLEHPSYRLRGTMGNLLPGDSMHVRVRRHHDGGHSVEVIAAQRSETTVRGTTPVRAWRLLVDPGRSSRPILTVVDLAWLSLLFFPIGWWAPSWRLALMLTPLPLISLAVAHTVSVMLPSPWFAYAGAAGAVAVGQAARSASRRRRNASGDSASEESC